MSALVGIAIDQGFIQDVEDPIYRYLPSYAPLFSDEKKRIKVKHMLTMTPRFSMPSIRTGREARLSIPTSSPKKPTDLRFRVKPRASRKRSLDAVLPEK
jgi:hypothetical protein